ncbi:MAG: PilZ domain-containing protein [Gammaproteobacteria bacterium]|nr:MAG: PilZ domain-containing protein [Gammaproteobacteria bacterium]
MERRRHPRFPVSIRVDLMLPERVHYGVSRDLSPGGIFIELPAREVRQLPDLVRLNVRIWTGQVHLSRQLRARVVRRMPDGVALRFPDGDLLTRAAADEVLFYLGVERYNRAVVTEWLESCDREESVA